MPPSTSYILERIESVFDIKSDYYTEKVSLLHAYIACLSFAELCNAITLAIAADSNIRLALRKRILRLLRESCTEGDLESLIELAEQTVRMSESDKAIRKTTDALYSMIFEFLPLQKKQMILDRWVDRGTTGGMARWLRAAKEHPESFNHRVALAYWRSSKDYRAAKLLAYQAPPDFLKTIISEIV